MSNRELTERYIYAVTRKLPARMRTDVEQELAGLIDDMVTERTGGGEPAKEQLREVLEELGAPAKLARQYSPSGEKSLIGPDYYPTYCFVLGIVLLSVTIGMAVTAVVAIFTGGAQGGIGSAILHWLGNYVGCATAGFTVTTILFFIFDRAKAPVQIGGSLDDLPEVPTGKQRISRGDCVVGIIFCIAFVIILLVSPAALRFNTPDGVFHSIFVVSVLQSRAFFIIVIGLMGIISEGFKLYEGRHTWRQVAVCAITGAISVACLYAAFWQQDIVNPLLVATLTDMASSNIFTTLSQNLPRAIVGLGALAFVIDVATESWHAYRYSH